MGKEAYRLRKAPPRTRAKKISKIVLQKGEVIREAISKYNLESVYGGMYMDHLGGLHINMISDVSALPAGVKLDGVHYHQVTHSMKALEETMAQLQEQMSALDIVQLSLDEQQNKVMVVVRELDEEKRSQIEQAINPETVVFEEAVGEVRLTKV